MCHTPKKYKKNLGDILDSIQNIDILDSIQNIDFLETSIDFLKSWYLGA